MPKLFVCSDIHSGYTQLKKALDGKGFDPNNETHWLVVCGDCFDRLGESKELLKYLMSLKRKILVKGNHDLLLEELCTRGFPYSHDKSNGTIRTVQDISGKYSAYDFAEACNITWNKTARYRELLVNYFETQNYIFVHSWIPTIKEEKSHPADKWIPLATDKYMEDWRNANDVEWEEAMWGNGINRALDGLNQTDKTIVMGHYHCSYGHLCSSDGKISEFGEDAIWEPWHHNNCIAIDRCVAYTGELNLLVIEDEFDKDWLEKYGDKI